jgi:hypothetical protein
VDAEGGWCGGHQETKGDLMSLRRHEVMTRCIDGAKTALKAFGKVGMNIAKKPRIV